MTSANRPRIPYVRAPMYAKQRQAYFDPRRFVSIEASTKAGKTTGGLIWLTDKAVMSKSPGRYFWWIAPFLAQARIAFRRFKKWAPREYFHANESLLEIEIANGNVIQFKSAEKPDGLYGDDVYGFVFDEASRARREAWHAVRSTVTKTRAEGRFIGNVRGRKNFFYELARRGQSETDPAFGFHQITAWDAVAGGVLDRAEIEDARRQLPAHIFAELYECKPSDDGGNPFGLKAIEAISRAPTGKPVKNWGVDLASAVNWTVCFGLDEDGNCARIERFRLPWPETFDRVRRTVGSTPALFDETGVGKPVVQLFQRPEMAGMTGPACPNVQGFNFSPQSKQWLLERLSVAIQSSKTSIPYTEQEPYYRTEYETMEYEVKRTHVRYAAAEGLEDDVVMAHALAVEGRSLALGGSSRGGAAVPL